MKKKNWIYIFLIILIVVAICVLVVFSKSHAESKTQDFSEDMLEVHFIDVGQGDCTLVEMGGEYMLIDTGIPDKQNDLSEYLGAYGIENFKYVIATHPHQDHIGSMDYVIGEYEIDTFFMPEVVNTTMCYQNMMEALDKEDVNVVHPKQGEIYELGEAQFTIISDENVDYDDNLNNYSVGIKLTYGDMDFVLCGDAEYEAEQDIIGSGIDLNAEVLKINHHGSASSSSKAFLEAVSPKHGIICVGADNSYGHPKEKILSRLEDMGINVHRTDEKGNIVIKTDGKELIFYFEKNEVLALLN